MIDEAKLMDIAARAYRLGWSECEIGVKTSDPRWIFYKVLTTGQNQPATGTAEEKESDE